jgi:hypothetical protein
MGLVIPWPMGSEAKLEELWNQGLRASRCAVLVNQEFGTQFTRNAILGKVWRMGLSRNKKKLAKKLAPARVKKAARVEQAKTPQPQKLPAPPLVLCVVPPLPAWAPLPNVKPVPLASIQSTHCRWPVEVVGSTEYLCCGALKLETGPYCKLHAKRSYLPNNKKRSGIIPVAP